MSSNEGRQGVPLMLHCPGQPHRTEPATQSEHGAEKENLELGQLPGQDSRVPVTVPHPGGFIGERMFISKLPGRVRRALGKCGTLEQSGYFSPLPRYGMWDTWRQRGVSEAEGDTF